MNKLARKIEKMRQMVHIKLYAFLCLILLIVVGTYSYFQFQEYRIILKGAQKSEEFVLNLRPKVSEAKAKYDENKREFDQLSKVVEQNLEKVFPSQENYTELTRQMDTFEESLARSRSPFEVPNIAFQVPVQHNNYSVLPFSMTITSSSENFTKFLHMMENSGAIDGDVRLMSISSIRLSFQGSPVSGSPNDIINFTVQVNAYFQK